MQGAAVDCTLRVKPSYSVFRGIAKEFEICMDESSVPVVGVAGLMGPNERERERERLVANNSFAGSFFLSSLSPE